MLPEAIEKDRLIKIGYGSGGDTKPRDGDFGVVTHLPEKSRVLILGNLGECVGSMNRGGILNIEGSCSSMLGAFQSSGRIVVERDVGDRLAMNMKGGDIVVMGSAGIDACAGMVGGTVGNQGPCFFRSWIWNERRDISRFGLGWRRTGNLNDWREDNHRW